MKQRNNRNTIECFAEILKHRADIINWIQSQLLWIKERRAKWISIDKERAEERTPCYLPNDASNRDYMHGCQAVFHNFFAEEMRGFSLPVFWNTSHSRVDGITSDLPISFCTTLNPGFDLRVRSMLSWLVCLFAYILTRSISLPPSPSLNLIL